MRYGIRFADDGAKYERISAELLKRISKVWSSIQRLRAEVRSTYGANNAKQSLQEAERALNSVVYAHSKMQDYNKYIKNVINRNFG